MLSVGSNLTSQTDSLKKVKVDYLYHSLRNPKPVISTKIAQLRIVRNLDAKQYAFLKRQLPYFVCAMFNPPFRRTENFSLLASTGRAAKILANATGMNTHTVHGEIYKFTDLNQNLEKVASDRETHEVDATGQLFLNFGLSPKEYPKICTCHAKALCISMGIYSHD